MHEDPESECSWQRYENGENDRTGLREHGCEGQQPEQQWYGFGKPAQRGRRKFWPFGFELRAGAFTGRGHDAIDAVFESGCAPFGT